MIKPTKTELKQREQAKKDGKLYYKRVMEYKKVCPYCDQPPLNKITGWHCYCGKWDVWLGEYTPNQLNQGEPNNE